VKVNLEPDELDVRIEMIPLVDVIFCILAFFILAAVGLARGEGPKQVKPRSLKRFP
jgi:biopolymer transport protein ExbD